MASNLESPVRQLPLWKTCVDWMRTNGVHYGDVFSSQFFEEHLSCKRTTYQFGLAVSKIRHELEKDGFYLSGRGQKGNQFVILTPNSNSKVMNSYQRAAIKALARGVILGTNTRLDALTQKERARHEALLEKLSVRSLLINRSQAVSKLVQKVKPRLLHR